MHSFGPLLTTLRGMGWDGLIRPKNIAEGMGTSSINRIRSDSLTWYTNTPKGRDHAIICHPYPSCMYIVCIVGSVMLMKPMFGVIDHVTCYRPHACAFAPDSLRSWGSEPCNMLDSRRSFAGLDSHAQGVWTQPLRVCAPSQACLDGIDPASGFRFGGHISSQGAFGVVSKDGPPGPPPFQTGTPAKNCARSGGTTYRATM